MNDLLIESARIEANELLQLVSFNVGKEEYAINIHNIQSIIRMVELTKIPNSPEFIIGVINLRGQVIPIIELSLKLGLKNNEYGKNSRFIIVEFKNTVIGFLVDNVNEVLRIPSNMLDEIPDIISETNKENISSVIKLDNRLILLLDIDSLISENYNTIIENTKRDF